METVVERPGALDVHKEQVTACVRKPGEGRAREQHLAEFPRRCRGCWRCATGWGRTASRTS